MDQSDHTAHHHSAAKIIDKTLLLTVRSIEALFSRVKGNFYRKTGATIEFS
jgi:hypothetical protein